MSSNTPPIHEPSDDAEARLDQAFARLRHTDLERGILAEARERAWRTVEATMGATASSISLSTCADYRGLIGQAIAGTLPLARKRLFDDHLQGCVDCQAALRAARGQRSAAALQVPPAAGPEPRRWGPSRRAWAMAASFLLVLGLTGWASGTLTPSRVLAQVQSWQKQLADELARLRLDLNALPDPALRHASSLAASLPADTVLYVALPNLSGTMAQADALLKQRIQESPVLKQWWEQNLGNGDGQAAMDRVMGQMGELGGYLGDEIVLAMSLDGDGEIGAPLVLAETKDPVALRRAVEERSIRATSADDDLLPPMRVVTDPGALTRAVAAEDAMRSAMPTGPDGDAVAPMAPGSDHAEDGAALLWMADGRVALSPSARAVQALVDASGSPRFSGASLYRELERAYAGGVNTVIGVDLERIMAARSHDGEAGEPARGLPTGMEDARHLVVTEVSQDDSLDLRAELSFSGARQGISAWLAEPADLRALDFFSPETHLAMAGVSAQPTKLLEQLLDVKAGAADLAGSGDAAGSGCDPASTDGLQAIAAAAGGEFAFALDGPVLPRPAWTLAMNLRDAAAFQSGLDRLLACLDSHLRAAKEGQVIRGSGSIGGHAMQSVSIERTAAPQGSAAGAAPPSFHYLVVDGYFVAASEPGILDRALRLSASGVNLRASGAFRKLLPADLGSGNLRASALLYQNLGEVAQPLSQALKDQAATAPSAASDSASASAKLGDLTANLPPGLLVVSAGTNRITLRGQADGAGLGSLLTGMGLLLHPDSGGGSPDTH